MRSKPICDLGTVFCASDGPRPPEAGVGVGTPGLVGLKSYFTNIPVELMPAGEVIASPHDLRHVGRSFQMLKIGLAARPILHHTREALEAPSHHRVRSAGHRSRPAGHDELEHQEDRSDPASDPGNHRPHRWARTRCPGTSEPSSRAHLHCSADLPRLTLPCGTSQEVSSFPD